jgi:hypothetical protein
VVRHAATFTRFFIGLFFFIILWLKKKKRTLRFLERVFPNIVGKSWEEVSGNLGPAALGLANGTNPILRIADFFFVSPFMR